MSISLATATNENPWVRVTPPLIFRQILPSILRAEHVSESSRVCFNIPNINEISRILINAKDLTLMFMI